MKFTIETADGYELYCQFDAIENPIATIVLSHGFVEYGAHYNGFAKKLNAAGFNIVRYDERGHGRTTAPLGHVEAFQDFADDLKRVITWVKDKDSSMPVFPVGFSLGGMITLLYAIMNPYEVEGIVLMGALSKPQMQFDKVKQDLSIQDFLKLMGTDGDEGIQQLVTMDSPYVLKKATVSFVREALIEAELFIQDHLNRINYPTLIIHGEKDPIIPVSWSVDMAQGISSANVEVITYPNGFHDLLRTRDSQKTVDDMVFWFKKQL